MEIPVNTAYRLINHGPLLWVSTCSSEGRYDIAPIAWSCPCEMKPTRVLLVMDMEHQTYHNIMETKAFITCVPHSSQADLVRKTGAVSGKKCDKFVVYSMECFEGEKIKAKIPLGCIGYLECQFLETIERVGTGLVIGECVRACVLRDAFNERFLTEKKQGKTLHHLGKSIFAMPSDTILDQ